MVSCSSAQVDVKSTHFGFSDISGDLKKLHMRDKSNTVFFNSFFYKKFRKYFFKNPGKLLINFIVFKLVHFVWVGKGELGLIVSHLRGGQDSKLVQGGLQLLNSYFT